MQFPRNLQSNTFVRQVRLHISDMCLPQQSKKDKLKEKQHDTALFPVSHDLVVTCDCTLQCIAVVNITRLVTVQIISALVVGPSIGCVNDRYYFLRYAHKFLVLQLIL